MPKNKFPAAHISVESNSDRILVLSTLGTKAAPSSKLASWSISWGDGQVEHAIGNPPPSLAHSYASDGEKTIIFTVRDKNTLVAQDQMSPFIIKAVPPVVTPPPTPGVPAKALLQQSDFTLLGAFYGVGNFSNGYGLTSIREGGVFKLMEWISDGTIQKYVPPTPSMSQAYNGPPSPSGVIDMGVPFGTYDGFAWQGIISAANDRHFHGLHYDETTGRLYWCGPTYYQTVTSPEPVIGYSTWNSVSWLPAGYWAVTDTRAAGGYGNRWQSNIGALPSWFSTGFAGGRKLFVGGGGGYFMGIHPNDTSIGPNLFAMDHLAGTEAWKGIATSANLKPILSHPAHFDDLTSYPLDTPTGDGYLHLPRVGRRPVAAPQINRYGNASLDAPSDSWLPDATAPQGYLTKDGCSNPCIFWLETANKFGLIVPISTVTGSSKQIISAITYIGMVAGNDYWDITVASTAELKPNMILWLENPASPHYGGYLMRVAHDSNTSFYAPSLPDGSTTNPILSGTKFRAVNLETNGVFTDLSGSVGKRVRAGVWYGGGGGKAPGYTTWWQMFHPADLAANIALTSNWSELDPRSEWEVNYDRRREYPNILGAGEGWEAPPGALDMAFDDVANILYVLVHGGDIGGIGSPGVHRHMVYCYSVTP